MDVGFIGLGKLGFPCAVGIAMGGHRVVGYDTDGALVEGYRRGEVTPFEPGLEEQYAGCRSRIEFASSVDEVVARCRVILVAVPTPHAPRHDGSYPYDGVPRDFEREPLRGSLREVGRAIGALPADGPERAVLVISTVTPGTMTEDLGPATEEAVGRAIGDGWSMVYNPFFIGQSTVVRDFLNPEFVLVGLPEGERAREIGAGAARALYGSLHGSPLREMSWTEAECVKLCYNTYLGLKVLFANTVMELCHRLPDADCDVVNGALKLATDRLVSPKYMDGGMADGGPCHGRDQMAMSHAARAAGLGFNVFDVINHGRDEQTRWLAGLIEAHARGAGPGGTDLPVVLLGMAFKPGTNQTQGSPALLLANLLRERGVEPVMHDPAIRPDAPWPGGPALYFLSTNWPEYRRRAFRPGDVVIDPWGAIDEPGEGVALVRVGRRPVGRAAEGRSPVVASVAPASGAVRTAG